MSPAEKASPLATGLTPARAERGAPRTSASRLLGSRAWRRLAPYLGTVFALLLFGGALYLLHHKVAAYRVRDVRAALEMLTWGQVAIALGLAAASYALFMLYDLLALRHIGKRLPYGRVALAAFTSYAFVHNFGFGSLLHAAIRYRLYGPLALRTADIAEVTAFVNVTFMIGLALIFPVIAVLDAPALQSLGLPATASFVLAGLALLLVAAYATLGWWVKGPIHIFGWALKVPRPETALAQIVLSLADLALASAVLYFCLPNFTSVPYPHAMAVFVLALTAGIISHVPGGLGVFDTIVLVGLGNYLPGHAILAALLVFRIVYFLLPLLVAGILFGAVEAMMARRRIARASYSVGAWIAPGAPLVLAGCTFLCGAVLLFSSATPEGRPRLRLLYSVLPLQVVEASHFIGSIVGVLLLLLAMRLQHRSRTAWVVTLVLLLIGSLAALLTGLDWPQAGFLLLFFLVLLVSRDEFYRRSSLVAHRFTAGWFRAIGVVLGSALWLGLFSYKHVQFGNEVWWRFALYADASRFLRASVAVAVVALVVGARQLLVSARSNFGMPDADDLPRAAEIVAASPEARASLALLGDKALLFHPGEDSFIVYRISRRSWVAFGDPIGPPERWQDLMGRLDALATSHGGWPVFFGVDEAGAQICRKLGFAVRKIGEAAIVPLEAASLETIDPALREAWREVERLGCRFDVVEPEELPRLMPALRAVATEWEADKRARTGTVSAEAITPDRLRPFPVAVVRSGYRIVAFARLSHSAGMAEIALDLMRHATDVPARILDFLMVEVMLWAKREGYRSFNLGLAPLRGLDRRNARSRWDRLGIYVYQHGEHYSNFAELRRAKSRFRPRWEPRFVSSRAGIPLARALPDIARAIIGTVPPRR
jgi:phosphatidylglycerol lysyltransferase